MKTYNLTIPEIMKLNSRINTLKNGLLSDTSIMVRLETELDTEEACKPK